MTANKSPTATFNLEKHSLTVAKGGTGAGTVESTPAGISCGATCSAEFDHGASVTLKGTSGANAKAVVWTGCDSVNGSNECVLSMTANKSPTATFAVSTHTLIVTSIGSGSVNASAGSISSCTSTGGICSSRYPVGFVVTLTASPASGFSFSGWSGGGCSGTGNCVMTVDNETTVTATFSAIQSPSSPKCTVPKLMGKTLSQAKKALNAAHCTLGKVTKTKARNGHKSGTLVVKSSSPSAGSTPANSAVDLKLTPKTKKKN